MSDLISRADAIEAVRSYFKDRMGKSKCDYDEELQVYVISKEERTMLTYNKGINDKLRSLPSAELPKGELISRADAIEAVCGVVIDEFDVSPTLGYEVAEKAISALPSAEAVSEDTQTEERARFVAKETELAHIEAKLENAEKRLQGACTANFVAEQLDRLRNMTDEERLNFLKRFFSPSAEAVQGEWIDVDNEPYCECSVCGSYIDNLDDDYAFCPRCGARMKGGAE